MEVVQAYRFHAFTMEYLKRNPTYTGIVREENQHINRNYSKINCPSNNFILR